MNPTNYISNRYASITGPKISAFYGEDPDGISPEWVGLVYKNDKEVFRKTNTELLDVAGNESPEALLLATLTLYLNR